MYRLSVIDFGRWFLTKKRKNKKEENDQTGTQAALTHKNNELQNVLRIS